MDLYNRGAKLDRAFEKLHATKEISTANKKLIIQFLDSFRAEGKSVARTDKYLRELVRLAKLLDKPFKKATRDDINHALIELEKAGLAPTTLSDYRVCLKKFYKWINGGEDYPPVVKHLKTKNGATHNHLPDDLLTEEDILKLIKATDSSKYKCLISMFGEAGIRIGELLQIKIANVQFDEYGVVLVIPGGKTGARRIRLISSEPYLRSWLEKHPTKKPSSYLFVVENAAYDPHGNLVKKRGDPLGYQSVYGTLQRIAKKAGITKNVNPHFFRHSAATRAAKHLTEAQMKQYFGWAKGSDMPAVYVHLSGRDMDDAILKMHGLKKEEELTSQLTPIKCKVCGHVNPPDVRFCAKCGKPLTIEAAMKVQAEQENKIKKYAKEAAKLEFLKLVQSQMR